MAGEEKQEVRLYGGTVKVGEQFCFQSLDSQCERGASSTVNMVKRIGSGPFTLLGVKYYPRDGYPLWMLRFLSERAGEEVEITSDYFAKHDGVISGGDISLCEEGCRECQEDQDDYTRLIHELSAMHIGSSLNPDILCSAALREFDQAHPDFSRYPQLQGEIFEIASRHKLRWAS